MDATVRTPAVRLSAATKRFPTSSGGVHTAIRDVDLEVAAGEFVAIVGPTGCGKSTTLSLVSGLQPPSNGTVEVQGRPVADPAGMLNLIAALPPGQPAKVRLKRQGQDVDATITVGRRPKPQARVE